MSAIKIRCENGTEVVADRLNVVVNTMIRDGDKVSQRIGYTVSVQGRWYSEITRDEYERVCKELELQ